MLSQDADMPRLISLEPKWLSPTLFAFRCPHCRDVWLTCKTMPLSNKDQHDLYKVVFGDDWNLLVVPSAPDTVWRINGRGFEYMSVTPSIDASKSGHWHGHISGGEIT